VTGKPWHKKRDRFSVTEIRDGSSRSRAGFSDS